MKNLKDFAEFTLSFYDALEERQEEIEEFATKQFLERGCCSFEFDQSTEKDIVYKKEYAKMSMYYAQPLMHHFQQYQMKLVKGEYTNIPLSLYASAAFYSGVC